MDHLDKTVQFMELFIYQSPLTLFVNIELFDVRTVVCTLLEHEMVPDQQLEDLRVLLNRQELGGVVGYDWLNCRPPDQLRLYFHHEVALRQRNRSLVLLLLPFRKILYS